MKYKYTFINVTNAREGIPSPDDVVGEVYAPEAIAHLVKDNVVRLPTDPGPWVIDRLSVGLGQMVDGKTDYTPVLVYVYNS